MITVHFEDSEIYVYENAKDAQDAILEAHAEGVLVELVHEGDCIHDPNLDDCYEKQYSCVWTVHLQKEF